MPDAFGAERVIGMGSIGRPRASKPARSLPIATQAPPAPENTRWARSPHISGLPAPTGLLPQNTIRCTIPGTLRKQTHGHPRHARWSHSPDDTGKRADWQAETPYCRFGWRAYSCCDWPHGLGDKRDTDCRIRPPMPTTHQPDAPAYSDARATVGILPSLWRSQPPAWRPKASMRRAPCS